MTKIFFVRHGETAWNSDGRYQGQSDVALSEVGLRQAEKLADNFFYGTPAAIYASDLIRAQTTAKILAAKFNLPVKLEPKLRELNFGAWEGKRYDEIKKLWPDEIDKFFLSPDEAKVPGGETVAELQKRTTEALKQIIAENPDGHIAVVAHGAVLRSLVCYALHIPLQYFWSIRQYNTAVSIVNFSDNRFGIELLNSTAHLEQNFIPGKI